MVSKCYIDAFDDGVCLKTSPALGRFSTTTDITVTNCCIGSLLLCTQDWHRNQWRLSKYCIFQLHNLSQKWNWTGTRRNRLGISGRIPMYRMSPLLILQCIPVKCPIFLRLGNRGRGQQLPSLVAWKISRLQISLHMMHFAHVCDCGHSWFPNSFCKSREFGH